MATITGSGGVVTSYLGYDALGQLALVSPQVGVPRLDYLLMADGVPHIESNSATGLTRRHVHGPGTDEPLLTYEGAGLSDKRYLHADERGSIIAFSNASGQVTQINAYDDYGIPQGKTPAGVVISGGTDTTTANFGRFGYTGQVWLPEAGLYHYKARAYSPTLGRFMQADPIGYEDGVNLYAYVGGDPINFSDPSGLVACTIDGDPTGICVTAIRGGSGSGGGIQGVTENCNAFVDRLEAISPRCAERAGGGGSANILPVERTEEEKKVNPLCEFGNFLQSGADKAGDFSLRLTQAGAVIGLAGVATAQPEVGAVGVAVIDTGAIIGLGAGALQFAGGIAQGLGGGGFGNAIAAVVSGGLGVVVSKGLKATIPRGYSGATLSKAQRNNRVAGTTIGALQNTIDKLSPRKVSCRN